ncbi:hypothetical protein CHS0354_000982 [Potamilus streckersoni]|uniref:Atos-like conserved domain-containing protein n=1 Tax=Potamilus streckersoni TaxID=2493646 RepID=A0AAE0VVN7_9BIVA|nr:hypothetical protein CHS0354_000982 [Potamilus streckersoni]
MKPEKGSEDMESPVCDPCELFENIGRLVMEARTPDTSIKGRVEGPHCPPLNMAIMHYCDSQKEECHRVQEFREQLELLWRNQIPMRMDVLLFPDCYHGKAEARTLEGTTFSYDENFLLLERWDLQLLPKRAQAEKMEGMVSGQFLFQAVRSYLHFSQLSSWLISTEGALSLHIVYRVYAPGESVSYGFSVEPEIHKFPQSDLGHMIMLSSVASLPRQGSVAVIPCKYQTDTTGTPLAAKHREEVEKKEWAFRQLPKKCSTPPQKKSPDLGSDFQEKESRPLSGRHDHTDSQENRTDFYGPEKLGKSNLRKPPSGRRPLRSKGSSKGDCLESKTRDTFLGRDIITVRDSSLQDICDIEPSLFHNVSKDLQRSAQILENLSHLKQNVNVPEKNLLPTKQTMPGPGSDSAEDPVSIGDNISIGLESESKLCKKTVPYSPQKTRPYQKPTSLFTSGNPSVLKPIQSTKRLPSPKVLMAASTKPLASFHVKRCLNLDEPTDNLSNIKLEAFTADDIQDFSKPLSPSQIEAYLSSLSSPIMGKSKASQLQQIPTTKCKFFIGEDENNVFQMTDSKEGFDTENSMKIEDLTSPSLSKNQTTPRIPKSEHPLKPSSLFRKCFSTSEVEDDLGRKGFSLCPDIGDISVFNNSENSIQGIVSQTSEKKNSSVSSSSSDVQSCHNELVTSSNSSTSANSAFLKKKTTDISVVCNLVEKSDSIEIHQDKNSAKMYADRNFQSFHDTGKEIEGHSGRTYSDLSLARQSISDQDEASLTKGLSLCKQLLKRDFAQNVQYTNLDSKPRHLKTLPSTDDMHNFQLYMERSASIMFNAQTGLPTRSSPAPIKKKSSSHFDYDSSLTSARAIKNAISCSKLTLQSESKNDPVEDLKIISTSAPASTNCLLGNFEESVLNGRIEPVGVVEGFTAEVGAGGSFCPKHVSLPVAAYFFQLSDDNAPSPYLGHVNLEPLGKRGYHIPRRGTVQVTLFNPNKTVVKMFVVMYDLSDMPANCQTFLRQRTVYMPVDPESSDPSFLRYLIHLRLASSKSGKIYLHTDIRLIFARDKFEFDPQVANYELRSFTEGPHNPKYSPKR